MVAIASTSTGLGLPIILENLEESSPITIIMITGKMTTAWAGKANRSRVLN